MNQIAGLKEDLRRFAGLLSIKEIMSNLALIRVLDRLERMLLAAGA